MSDTSDPKEAIKEELTEQVDVGSLVDRRKRRRSSGR